MTDCEHEDRDILQALDLMGARIKKEFPNPQRIGCPDEATLREIAQRTMPIREAELWCEHILTCSPCYKDLCRIRTE